MKEKSIALTESSGTGAWRDRVAKFLTHVLIIGILFILPEVLSSMGRPYELPWPLKLGGYAKSLIYIVLFYASYYLLLPRSLEKGKGIWRMIVGSLLLIAVGLLLIWLLNELIEPYWQKLLPDRWRHRPPRPEMSKILWQMKWMIRDIVMLVLTISLSVTLKVGDNWMRIRQHAREQEALRREQELTSLKSQLNPHFLFNTLNTIYALIAVDPDKAQNAVHELSSMLRYVLYEDSAEVPLLKEVRFIETYVRLMEMRMGDSMRIELDIDISADMEDAKVPPLIFVAIVGNVFKHGNTGRRDDTLRIGITAHDGTITCSTANPIAPETDTPDGKKRPGGIGLQNLRRRLALLYGDKARLDVNRGNNIFTTRMTITLT